MLPYIFLLALIGVIIFEIKLKSKLEKDQISETPLSKSEIALTWLFCIFNPILGGAILYYGWRKRLPAKAKAANKISWMAFLIIIIYALVIAKLNLSYED